DWGWFAFVHDRKLENPPTSFTELAESDLRVVIQDPRSSTPGLGLLLWVKAAYGDRSAEVWEALADNIVTVTPGWSEAYGLFLAGEADLVLSYTTSPAYHLIAEGDDTKAAALFDEGHYLQIEVAGKLASSDQPELADRFLAFLLSDAVQSVIPETNWMYPAELPSAGLPRGFDQFRPATSLYLSPDAAASVRDAGCWCRWLRWRGAGRGLRSARPIGRRCGSPSCRLWFRRRWQPVLPSPWRGPSPGAAFPGGGCSSPFSARRSCCRRWLRSWGCSRSSDGPGS
ncbi:MAG: hypothetical protein B7Y02_05365, partial [Rhodobacterales bacterium 17-64-5]